MFIAPVGGRWPHRRRYYSTEGAMFPSIFLSAANDNYSIARSITSHILSGFCKEDDFSNIPTHVRSTLKNASSSTSSDYRYAIFGHDLMCSIAVNRYKMRQHRKGMNSSNTVAGGLDLRCKDYSNFPHSIDSRQVVKNYARLKSIFNGIFSSHLPVTWENFFVNG